MEYATEGTSSNDDLHQQLSRLANSKEFTELERKISRYNPKFADLPRSLRLTAIYCLRHGHEGLIKDLWRLFYRRQIPTIKEFLTSKYLGVTGDMIFPKLRHMLEEEVFAPGSTVKELIFQGSIGWGKSAIARIAHEYNLIRVTSLIDPHAVLGASPESTLVVNFFSVDREKAALASLAPFKVLIRKCPLFVEVDSEYDVNNYPVCEQTAFKDYGHYMKFSSNIMVYSGSQMSHAISFDIIQAFLDEIEFREGSVESALDLYKALLERIRSRFLDSVFTLATLISSAKYTTGVIPSYLKNRDLKKDDPYTRVYAYPIWEVRQFDAYKEGWFWILRGTSNHPHRILEPDEGALVEECFNKETKEYEFDRCQFKIHPRCELLRVPLVYLSDFRNNLLKNLQDLAGVATETGATPFDDTSSIEAPWLTPEIELEASVSSEKPLLAKLPSDMFFITPGGQWQLKRFPLAPRYIHLDLAAVTYAGIGMCHKEYEVRDFIKVPVFVMDLVINISAPDRIKFAAIKDLIIDLVKKVNVRLLSITADQYQSEDSLQTFRALHLTGADEKTSHEKDRIKVISVDRSPEPYRQFSQLVADRRFHCGKAPKLIFQLENLKDQDDKITSAERKDISDGCAGAIWRAMLNVQDEPTYEFKPLKEIRERILPKEDYTEITEEDLTVEHRNGTGR